MNLTLNSIFLSSLFTPIQLSTFSQRSFSMISNSKISHSFNSFVHFSPKFHNLILTNNFFDEFISSIINSSNSNNDHYISHLNRNYYHESFSQGNLIVDNCKFNNCRNRDFTGGAIFSICDTIIKDSTFSKCFSGYGGAFSTFANTIIINTNFYKCFSQEGGAFLIKFGSLVFNSSSISFCTAAEEGGAFKTYQSAVIFENIINYSYCSSVSRSSISCIDAASVSITNDICSFSKSYESYGAICIANRISNISINECIFSNLKANDISTALYISGSTPSCSSFHLSNSIFYHCSGKFPSIYCSKMRQFVLIGCVFSNEQNDEIKGQNPTSQDNNYFNVSKIDKRYQNIPKIQIFFIPRPYIMPTDYVNDLISILQAAFTATVLAIFASFLLYELLFVYKKINQNNKIA